jgi:hypothetical protein
MILTAQPLQGDRSRPLVGRPPVARPAPAASFRLQVGKAPCRPRSWTNSSPS